MNPIPIGTRIQKLRRRQSRTLEEVARQCGFTKSLLSKIERGRTNPPLATLAKLADALGIKLSDLLSHDAAAGTVYTPATRLAEEAPTVTDKGYAFHLFAGNRPDKLMQPFLFTARKGEIKPGPLSPRGEEFVYVLSGQIRFRVGAVEYTLGPGDSLYFDGEEEHDLQVESDEARYLAIFCEPSEVPNFSKES